MGEFTRSELVLGKDAVERLGRARVAVFGVGGVGGYVVEALARTGVGSFLIVDNDKVSESNLNRQIIALHSTIGKFKVDVIRERILDINPDAQVDISKSFYLPENADEIDLSGCDYIVDAVDTVTAKIEIIMRAKKLNIPVISSMGTGNKLDPTKFIITDIYKTSVCPLAKVMRHELKKRGIESLKVVYSTEPPICREAFSEGTDITIETNVFSENLTDNATAVADNKDTYNSCSCINGSHKKRSIPGSVAFVPSVAGLIIASEVVKDLCY